MSIDTSTIYLMVDSMPTMPDGQSINDGFNRLFSKDFRYPNSMTCLIYRLKFEFVISYDGSIIAKKVIIRGYDDCEKDVEILKNAGLEFLDRFPKCKPGKYKGNFAKVKFTFPYLLNLQEQ